VFLLKLNLYVIYKLFYFTSCKFCFCFISLHFELSKQIGAKFIHGVVKKSGSVKNFLTSGSKSYSRCHYCYSSGTVLALYGLRLKSNDENPQNAVFAQIHPDMMVF